MIRYLVLLVALVGCSTIDPETAQLERLKQAAERRDYTAIRNERIGCTAGGACAQSRTIRADACFALARGSSASELACPTAPAGPARNALADTLDCASAEAKDAIDTSFATPQDGRLPGTTIARLRGLRAEALRCRRDLSAWPAAQPFNAQMAEEGRALAPAPEGAYYQANALRFEAVFGTSDPASRCALLKRARDAASVTDAPAPWAVPLAETRSSLATAIAATPGCAP